MKIKDLKEEHPAIYARALECQKEQGNVPNDELSLIDEKQRGNFNWDYTEEKDKFWYNINNGNFNVFYERYPENQPLKVKINYAIAMRCTQKNFDEIKPILESNGFDLTTVTDFNNNFRYLVNNHAGYLGKISNVSNYGAYTYHDRKTHEVWNANIFLEACGINVNKNNMKKQVELSLETAKEMYNSGNELFKKFALDNYSKEELKPKLEIGKWYKHIRVENRIVYKIDERGGYGFWKNTWGCKWMCRYPQNWRLATDEEIFEALKNEAIKRGYVGKHIKVLTDNNTSTYRLYGTYKLGYNFELEIEDRSVCYTIFKDGKWAEIIEETKYPTWEEVRVFHHIQISNYSEKLEILDSLLLARDIYNDGWTPDWNSASNKYCLYTTNNNINNYTYFTNNRIFAFKDKEIRGAFFKNFEAQLEQIKEFI